MEILLLTAVTLMMITLSHVNGFPSTALEVLQWFVSDEMIQNNVFFYLYTKNNIIVPQQLFCDNTVALQSSYFDSNKKTVIIIHGFQVNYEGTAVQKPKNKYVELFDYNVIGVDYGNLNSKSLLKIFEVVTYTYKIGRFLGAFVNFLVANGVNQTDVHLVGHSLGGHIAGFAGKYMKSRGTPLGRITALSPSYPGYQGNSPEYRLDSEDASFTDCIFTDYDNIDIGTPVCQSNFFPNGVGLSQPGCYSDDILGSCSHSRSVDLFVESIEPWSAFQVLTCFEIPLATKTKYCWPTNGTLMGEYANPKAPGFFYLTTSDAYPFSKG